MRLPECMYVYVLEVDPVGLFVCVWITLLQFHLGLGDWYNPTANIASSQNFWGLKKMIEKTVD